FLTTKYMSEGWKQEAITTGDQPGLPWASCQAIGVTMQNSYLRGFPQMYHSCTGSESHGPYDPFEEPFNGPNGADYKLQNARPDPYCLYTQEYATPPAFFPPQGNCFGYFPDEWMTFQVYIQVGPRMGDEFKGSHIKAWFAREGKPSELGFD